MISATTIEYLEYKQNSDLEREIDRIARIKSDDLVLRGLNLVALADASSFKGFHSLYIDQDINACKQWFYLASRLRAESCKYPGGWDMNTPHRCIFAILSDSSNIIATYSTLDTVNKWHLEIPSFKDAGLQPANNDYRFLVHYLQSILKQDWETASLIKQKAEQNIKKIIEIAKYSFAFGDALQQGNTEAMNIVIQTLLKPRVHKAFNKDNVYELNGQVWSHHPTMFTKLAWMHGYELQIDNPLVPMALMPIQSLDLYDDVYDFLKPGFQQGSNTSKSGFFAKLFGK